MASYRTYRDSVTGVVREYPVSLAANFPNLVEVEKGTKPLAFTPIPRSAVEDYQEAKPKGKKRASDNNDTSAKEEEED